ncbi:porin, partial [Methylobacterium sp. A54F]
AAWGSFQLSAAVHEVGIGNALAISATPFSPLNAAGAAVLPTTAAVARPSNVYGFGVQAGVKVNLPFIAPGDTFYLQGAHADGAMSYSGFQQPQGGEILSTSIIPIQG